MTPRHFIADFMKRNPNVIDDALGTQAHVKYDVGNPEKWLPINDRIEDYVADDESEITFFKEGGQGRNLTGIMDATGFDMFGFHHEDTDGRASYVVLRSPSGEFFLGPYIGDYDF